MYEVILRKPLKHPESAEGVIELKRSVNHELHALNLAERIIRMERVPWVEIKELQGRFSVRATLESDGKVHASLGSSRYNIRRKRRLETPWRAWLGGLTIAFLIGSSIWWYAVSERSAQVAEQSQPPAQKRGAKGTALPSLAGNEKDRTAKKGTPRVRLGDLEIMATAAGRVSPVFDKRYGLQPRTGYHFVVVNLTFKNAAQYPSCSYILDAWLQVDIGYEYRRSTSDRLKWPNAEGLLPTEESKGSYAFEVKDGTKPFMLKLVRNILGESICRTMQHRAGTVTGPKSVSLPLQELPSPAPLGEEPARPTTQPKSEAPAGPNGTQGEEKESPKVGVESGSAASRESQVLSAAPEAPIKQTATVAEPSSNGSGEQHLLPARRVFLTDRKSWEASGGFTPSSRAGPDREQRGMHPPKPDYLKSFRERCPAVVVTTEREKTAYIVLLDHSEWHSPPYKVAVFRPNGDLIYSGGTQLLKNAVKDICAAVTTAAAR